MTSFPTLRSLGLALAAGGLLYGCGQAGREDALAMQALQARTQALQDSFTACERGSTMVLPQLVADSRCLVFMTAENPAAPAGRQLPLRVMVVPAIRPLPEPDPFVILVGGPGQAATVDALALLPAFGAIRQARDILLVDQRGTGPLSPFDCDFGQDDEELLQASAELLLQIQEERLRECLATVDADPRYYTTDLAAADLDAIRSHLGYRQLNLWGASYGTRVALTYLKYFPQSTRTVVLDGVAPPGVLPLEAARDGGRALESIFALCREQSGCAAAFGQLTAHYEALLARFAEAQQITLRDPLTGRERSVPLQASGIQSLLFLLLYSRETARLIPLLIEELYQGNYQVLTGLGGFSGDLNIGMHYSVICSEDLPLHDARELAAAQDVFVYELLVLPRVEGCKVWPSRTLDPAFFTPVVSEVPVLLFSGTQDPVTPRRWADQVAATLGNSLHLVARGVGHGVFGYGCATRLIADFVDSASVAGLDPACIDDLAPRPFFLGLNGSVPPP